MNQREKCKQVRETLDLREVIEGWYGHELDKQGRGTCPFCEGSNKTKFRVIDSKGYKCAGCDAHGDVISFIMRRSALGSVKDTLSHIESKVGTDSPQPKKRRPRGVTTASSPSKETEVARWVYLKEDGTPAYEIARYDNEEGKKSFKPFKNGKMGLSSADRILYNLNVIANLTDETTYIVEGEKCADAMTKLGYIATCNPFGCGQWKGEFNYAKYFEGRRVVIMPDADEQGEKWLTTVMEDFRGKIEEARVVRLTKTWIKAHREFSGHDVSDFLSIEGEEKTKAFITKAERNSDIWPRGFEPGISLTPSQAYDKYLNLMDNGDFNIIDMSLWLPSLRVKARRGDLVCFLAGTKVGKSRLLMNMMYHVNNINYVVFDLELGEETVGERWCALHNGVSTDHVQAAHAMGTPYSMPDLSHIRIISCGNKDMVFIKERIDAEEQITGQEMHVAVIDYVGLMKGEGKSKTEMLSRIVEEFKGTMNDLGKTGVVTSQRLRPADKENGVYECPTLFDNKDASAIENSAQLSIGFWKQRDPNLMAGQVLAYSHGNANPDPFLLHVDELKIVEKIHKEGLQ